MSERQASMLATGAPDLIRNLRRGKAQAPQGRNLTKLARVLGVSETWLLTGEGDESPIPAEETGVAFGGIVEAGAFRPVDLLDQDGERRRIAVAPDPRFPAAAQHAFSVVGDSMDRAGILDGMYVVAVDLRAYMDRCGDLADGNHVVAVRVSDGGHRRELTVKRVRLFRDRIELRPDSSNPRHEPIVFPWPPVDHQAVEAAILAVVLQAVRVF